MEKILKFNNSIQGVKIDSSVIDCNFNEESGMLVISSQLEPATIDSNFMELESKINDIENDIRQIRIYLNKIENKVNILNALKK